MISGKVPDRLLEVAVKYRLRPVSQPKHLLNQLSSLQQRRKRQQEAVKYSALECIIVALKVEVLS
jgi:hypothetical protein